MTVTIVIREYKDSSYESKKLMDTLLSDLGVGENNTLFRGEESGIIASAAIFLLREDELEEMDALVRHMKDDYKLEAIHIMLNPTR